jgi:hypothetical protein
MSERDGTAVRIEARVRRSVQTEFFQAREHLRRKRFVDLDRPR